MELACWYCCRLLCALGRRPCRAAAPMRRATRRRRAARAWWGRGRHDILWTTSWSRRAWSGEHQSLRYHVQAAALDSESALDHLNPGPTRRHRKVMCPLNRDVAAGISSLRGRRCPSPTATANVSPAPSHCRPHSARCPMHARRAAAADDAGPPRPPRAARAQVQRARGAGCLARGAGAGV